MIKEPDVTYQNNKSFSKLIFIYNTTHKKIEFSNTPVEDFFGQPAIDPGQPPFLAMVEGNEIERIKNEWLACMSLKENETRGFNCSFKSAQGITTSLNVNAWGINPAGITASSGILFSAEQIATNEEVNSNGWKDKFTQLALTYNNYKEQYSEFIDSAAHDLYAPLRKLSVFVEKLTEKLEHIQQEEVQSYINRIKRTMKSMQLMIDQLTELSRVTNEDIHYSSCDLQQAVNEVIEYLQKTITEKNAEISVSDLPVIEGDKAQFKLLFQHLLENSLTFSRKNVAPCITIKSNEVNDEEKKVFKLKDNTIYYKIEIADNGQGFNPEFAKKIFKPFVRLHTKLAYSGHGLGLSICKKIVSNHNGIIFATGEENSGARFVMLLPRTN